MCITVPSASDDESSFGQKINSMSRLLGPTHMQTVPSIAMAAAASCQRERGEAVHRGKIQQHARGPP